MLHFTFSIKNLVLTALFLVFNLTSIMGQNKIDPSLKQNAERVITAQQENGITFRENKGQWNSDILYTGQFSNTNISFLKNGISFGYVEQIQTKNTDGRKFDSKSMVWNMKFNNANPNVFITPIENKGIAVNYLRNGNVKAITDVKSYKTIQYNNLYPNIDARYYQNGKDFKYDYIVKPQANITDLQISCEGVEKLSINKKGQLEITTPWGDVVEKIPYSYQVVNGIEKSVNVDYILYNDSTFGFKLPTDYNKNLEVVIDPVITPGWATYYGETTNLVSRFTQISDVRTDASGNVYVVGNTIGGMTTTAGVFDPTYNPDIGTCGGFGGSGDGDIYVTKLNSTGTAVIWCTYIGGGCDEQAYGIAVSSTGEPCVTGWTRSPNWPVANVPVSMQTKKPFNEAFVSKLNATGTAMVFSGYLGSDGADYGRGIAVDASDNVYVVGELHDATNTQSNNNFPTTVGVIKAALGGTNVSGTKEGFLTKLSSTGSMVYSTYVGGIQNDFVNAVAVNATGEAFITGVTQNGGGIPMASTNGGYSTTIQGVSDAFVWRVNATGTGLVYATFLGGNSIINFGESAYSEGMAIDVNANNEALVAGYTQCNNYPTTPGAMYSARTNSNYTDRDCFATRLSPTGTTLQASTYFGGSLLDYPTDVAISNNGDYFVTGFTSSTDFFTPSTSCYNNLNYSGGTYDVFVLRLNSNFSGFDFGTFVGGSGDDRMNFGPGLSLTPDKNCPDAVVIGAATNSSTMLPATTAGVVLPTKSNYSGNAQGYLVSFSKSAGGQTIDFNRTPNGSVVCKNNPVSFTASISSPSASSCVMNISPGSITWDFGDGSPTQTGTTVSHTYTVVGTYTITMTSSCPAGSKTGTITISDQPDFTLSISGKIDASCFGFTNGSATATPVGGNGHTYTWNNSQTGQTAINLGAATYTVTVNSTTGCAPVTASVTITQPTAALTASTSVNANVLCNGNATGSATVTGAGGTTNYTYLWLPSGGVGQTATNLAAGTYTIQVTDSKSCFTSATVTITQPNNPLDISTSVTHVNCANGLTGAAGVTVGGGTPNYNYSWLPGNFATSSISGVGAGGYTVTITDNNNCSKTASVTITQPAALDASLTTVSSTCGYANGQAAVSNPSGGTPNYTYAWSPGGAVSQTNVGLAAGPYSVTLTDFRGCSKTYTGTVNNIAGVTASAAVSNNVSCNGALTGSANATPNGGTSPFTYTWTNGSSAQTISGVAATSYTVTITDANSCPSTASVTITQPNLIQPSIASLKEANCNSANGEATLTAIGGTGGYTYTWSNNMTGPSVTGLAAATYTVTVRDGSSCSVTTTVLINNLGAASLTLNAKTDVSCNGGSDGTASVTGSGGTGTLTYSWSPNASAATAVTGLTSQVYTVTVRDDNNCLVSVTIDITQPSALDGSVSATSASCSLNNGGITTSLSGGSPGYTYLWTNGQTTSNLTGAAPGPYTVTVTDSKNCIKTLSATVGTIVPPAITLSGNASVCFGQNTVVTANVTGGTAPYGYTWSNGLTGTTSNTVAPTTTTTYTLTVTDASGCTAATKTVTVSVGAPLNISLTANNPAICSGASVTLTALATGGGNAYTYNWAPSGSGTTQTITPTSNITYSITVTDNCGSASATSTAAVVVNNLPTVTISADVTSSCLPPLCVNFTANSSAACVNSTWTFGDGNTSTNGVASNCYQTEGAFNVSLICTDANGCSTTTTNASMINVYGRPIANFSYLPNPVVQGTEVAFTNLTAPNLANSYVWEFGDSTANSNLVNPLHTFVNQGDYCVKLTATTFAGCKDDTIQCIKVNEKCTLPKEIPNVFSPNNDNINDVFTIKSTGLSQLNCTLFNRWGMRIYEYDAVKIGWDGRTFGNSVAPDGTYYYLLDATCIDGEKKEGQGFLHLVR